MACSPAPTGWPRVPVELPAGATVVDALRASGVARAPSATSISRVRRSASGAGVCRSTRRCATATGSRSIGRCRSIRRRRGACATAQRAASRALTALQSAAMMSRVRSVFVGALLVVEDLALALVVGAGDADAAVERRACARLARSQFSALRGGDLVFFGLGLRGLLVLGLLAARFELGVDVLRRVRRRGRGGAGGAEPAMRGRVPTRPRRARWHGRALQDVLLGHRRAAAAGRCTGRGRSCRAISTAPARWTGRPAARADSSAATSARVHRAHGFQPGREIAPKCSGATFGPLRAEPGIVSACRRHPYNSLLRLELSHAPSRQSAHLRRRVAGAGVLPGAAARHQPRDPPLPQHPPEPAARVRRDGHRDRSAPGDRASRRKAASASCTRTCTPRQQAAEVARVKRYESGVLRDPITITPDHDGAPGDRAVEAARHLGLPGAAGQDGGRHRHQPRPALRDAPGRAGARDHDAARAAGHACAKAPRSTKARR